MPLVVNDPMDQSPTTDLILVMPFKDSSLQFDYYIKNQRISPDRKMLADNCVPGGEVGHHCGLWDSLPLHLGAFANVLTNSCSGYQFNVRKDRLHDESLHWKSQVQLHQSYSSLV